MKKFLLSLAMLVWASPAFAVSLADWASTPIVDLDKTYTLIGTTGITNGDAGNITVSATNAFGDHYLNIGNTGILGADFTINYNISVNTPPAVILTSSASFNPVSSSHFPTLNVDWQSGTYNDSLNNPGTTSPIHSWSTTTIDVALSATGIDASNRIANMTFTFTQSVPEPSTFALAGLAVVGLVIARRRAR